MSQPVNTKQSSNSPHPTRFAPPLLPYPSTSNYPPFPSYNAVPMGKHGKADDHYPLNLERAKYMHKRYVLVSGIAKKTFMAEGCKE